VKAAVAPYASLWRRFRDLKFCADDVLGEKSSKSDAVSQFGRDLRFCGCDVNRVLCVCGGPLYNSHR